jgi:cytochrome c556
MWPDAGHSASVIVRVPGLLMTLQRPSIRRRTDNATGEVLHVTKTFALLAVLTVAAIGVARAEGVDVIETRQAGMDLVSADYAGIRAVVAAKGDVKTLENPGKAIARWARLHPSLFPKGSEQGHNTRALPAIWTDMAGFQGDANDLATAADKLAQFAKAGDADGVAGQIKPMGDACNACHSTYRAK